MDSLIQKQKLLLVNNFGVYYRSQVSKVFVIGIPIYLSIYPSIYEKFCVNDFEIDQFLIKPNFLK